jgi:tetratricopeptide (TPR) repeat protein
MRRALASPDIPADDALRIGEIYFQQAISNPARTVEALDAILLLKRKYPSEWKPAWYMGAILFNQGEYGKSIPHFRDALLRNPDNLQTLDVLSRAYMATRNYENAIISLGHLTEIGGATSETWAQLGFAYKQLSRDREAIEALRKALELDPHSMDALSSLALLYDARGEHDKSDRLYDDALSLYDDGTLQRDGMYFLLLNNYAYALSERGVDLERALEMAQRAVAEEPANSSYLDTIGWIYYKLDDYFKARDYIEQALISSQKQGITPGPVLYDHLGDVYYKMGQHDRAVDYWERALDRDPDNNLLIQKIQRIQN